jgi:hypothetical protein
VAGNFSDAIDSLSQLSGRESELWRPVLDVIPVEGAAISTIADFLGTETVSASSPLAARLDELQFDLGEGPCWDAMEQQGRPVLESGLRSNPPRELSSREERQSGILASVISRMVLDRAIRRADQPDLVRPEDQLSRRLIHQATGMVLAQLSISAQDARLLIQGHAFARGRSMRQIAEEILERRLDFSRQTGGFASSDE